jgi:hypothetical protein
VNFPPLKVEFHEGIHVVRDDLIPGGTKARYLIGLFEKYDEVVYASPAYGGAQLALAYCARAAGKKATIFVAKRARPHARTLEAKAAGARVFQVPNGYLSNVQAKARFYAEDHGAHLLAFGGESEQALSEIAAAASSIGEEFDQVWSAAGSGVLTRGLQRGIKAAEFYGVQVGKDVDHPGSAAILPSGFPFEKEIDASLPFPSCPNYDAKAWLVCKEKHRKGARVLFWNVLGPSPTSAALT